MSMYQVDTHIETILGYAYPLFAAQGVIPCSSGVNV